MLLLDVGAPQVAINEWSLSRQSLCEGSNVTRKQNNCSKERLANSSLSAGPVRQVLALGIQASYTTWHLMQELGRPLHAASGRVEGCKSPGASEASQLQM